MFAQSKKFKNVLSDYSVITLIISNLIIIALAIVQNWNFITVLWIYWFQSIIIGFFHFIKILTLKNFSSKGVRIDERPIANSKPIRSSFFFIALYCYIHFIYMGFLFAFYSYYNSPHNDLKFFTAIPESSYVFFSSIMFFTNHLFSFLYNRKNDQKKYNVKNITSLPYIRTIPIHFAIFIWFLAIISFGDKIGTGISFILFLLLKTLTDVIMHIIEHK